MFAKESVLSLLTTNKIQNLCWVYGIFDGVGLKKINCRYYTKLTLITCFISSLFDGNCYICKLMFMRFNTLNFANLFRYVHKDLFLL